VASLFRIAVVVAVFAAWSAAADAQPAQNIPRIGFISALTPGAMQTRVHAFRQGLKALGYIEGKNIVVEYRWGYGNMERLPALVTELAALKPQAIVTAGPYITRLFKQAGAATPIVMAFDPDPVGSGFVASLARPGGNITGLSIVAPEVSGKQIDVLRQIIPGLSRVAIVWDSKEPGNERARRETERAAQTIGARVSHVDVQQFNPPEDAFDGLRGERVDAVILLSNPTTYGRRPAITERAARHRLPVMYAHPEFVDDGGLMTYSVNMEDLFRRSASYVDKILKGAKPGELPIEQPYKFDLVINMKAAKEIGLTIPVGILSLADRVVQ
jgi:putative ABC transport system substrate-binding protein